MSNTPIISHRIRRVMRQAAEAMSRGEFVVARDLAQRVTEGAPTFFDGWMMLTEALAEMGQHEAGLDAVSRGIELHPDATPLQVQKCKFLLGLGQRRECLELVRSLASEENLDPWATDMLAMFLSMLDQVEEAATLYRQLCRIEPENPENWVNLGMSKLALGKLDEARDMAEHALTLAPEFTRARTLIASIRTASKDDNQVDEMRARLDSSPSLTEHVALGYALGKELEDLGQWDEAFAAYQQAGASKRRATPYDQRQTDALVDALIAEQDREFLEADHPGCGSDQPIFIFGMPRSGTTLVERILGTHEQVRAGGELRDFMDAVDVAIDQPPGSLMQTENVIKTLNVDFSELGAAYIQAVTARVGEPPHFTDKLPLNFMYAGLIAKAFPRARMIHVLRNPMDTIFSNFKVLFSDLNAYSYTLRDTANYYVAYHRLMRHWESALSGRIFTVEYEKLVGDVETQIRSLIEHCGLPWQESCLQPHRGEAAVTTASAVQVRSPVYGSAVFHWRHYEHLLGEAQRILDQAGIGYR